MNHVITARTITLAVILLTFANAHAVNVSSVWTANNGDPWNDAVNWTNNPAVPEFPDNTPGTNTFDVAIGTGQPALSTTVEINALQLGNLSPEGGIVTGSGTLTANLDTTIGTLGGFNGSGTFNAIGSITVDGGTFDVEGWTVNAMSDVFLGPTTGANINLNAASKLNPQGTLTLANGADIFGDAGSGSSHLLTLNGTVDLTATAPSQVSTISTNIDAKGGTTINILGDASLVLPSGRSVTLDSTTVSLNGTNGEFDVSSNLTIKGSTTIDAINGAKIRFINAVVNNQGTLTGSGGAGGSFNMTSGSFSGGIISFSPDLPFRSNAELGTGGSVSNIGNWIWESGKITGGGLTNDNDVEGEATTSSGIGGIMVENGTFTNNGHFSQQKTLSLNTNGKIDNASDATYLLNANLTATVTDESTRFLNDGNVIATASPTVTARFVQNSGTLTVKEGAELRLQGPTQLAGTVIIDDTGDAGSKLNYRNFSGGSESNNITYQFMNGSTGDVRFTIGTNAIKGTLSSTGTGIVLLTSGTLKVNGGDSATLNMAPTAPFQFEAPLLTTRIQTDGTLTNMGHFTWESGETVGPLPFENQGTIRVTGTMRIGDGAETATINNTGTINFEAGSGGITIQGGSKLDNKTGGLIDFQGGADISLLTGAAGTPLENNGGEIRKSGGSTSLISVPFTQNSGTISVHDGTLQLNNDPNIFDGDIEVMKMGATTPVLLITAPNTTTDANITFNDGEIRYGTGSGTHTFKGRLNGTGADGTLTLVGGTYIADGDITFNIDGTNTLVNHANGTMTGDNITNEGTYLFQNGAINNPGGFTNKGTFNWAGGQINIDILNQNPDDASSHDAAATPANFIIDTNTIHTLATSATLDNQATITHTGSATLRLSQDAEILNNEDAVYEFTADSPGSISKTTTGTIGTSFTNQGTIRRSGTPSSTVAATINVPFTNSTEGLIDITNTSPSPTTNTLSFNFNDGGSIEGGDLRMTGTTNATFDRFNVFGLDIFFSHPTGTSNPPQANFLNSTLRGTITGIGNGAASLGTSTVPTGINATLEFSIPSRVNFANGFKIFGLLDNKGRLDFQADALFSDIPDQGGTLTNTASGSIIIPDTAGNITITGSANTPAIRVPGIDNDGQMNQSSNLTLKDHIRIINSGMYQLNNASLNDSETNPGGTFFNSGTFTSSPGGASATNTIDVPFNNTSLLIAEEGTTVFNDLQQYDSANQALTAGTYTLRDNAIIQIDGVEALNENNARLNLTGDAQFNGIEKISKNTGQININEGNQFNGDNDLENTGVMSTNGQNAKTTIGGNYNQTPTGSTTVKGNPTIPEPDQPEQQVNGDANHTGGNISVEYGKYSVTGSNDIKDTMVKTKNAKFTSTDFSCDGCSWFPEKSTIVESPSITFNGNNNVTLTDDEEDDGDDPASFIMNGTSIFGTGTHHFSADPSATDPSYTVTGDTDINPGANTIITSAAMSVAGTISVASGGMLTTSDGGSISSNGLTVSGITQIDISTGGSFQVNNYLHTGGSATFNLPSLDAFLDGGASEMISADNVFIQDGSIGIGFPTSRPLTEDIDNILLARIITELTIGDASTPTTEPQLDVGNSPGVLVVDDVTITPNATVSIEIGGPDPAKDYDVLYATGAADLAGTLALSLIAPFDPALGDTFDILQFATRDPDDPGDDSPTTFDLITGAVITTDLALAPIYTDTTLTLRASIPGDTNFDNAVTVADLSTFALNFGTTPGPGAFHLGDFNADNAITVADLSLLALNFGFDLDAATPATGLSIQTIAAMSGLDLTDIPEPTTHTALLLTWIYLILRRFDHQAKA